MRQSPESIKLTGQILNILHNVATELEHGDVLDEPIEDFGDDLRLRQAYQRGVAMAAVSFIADPHLCAFNIEMKQLIRPNKETLNALNEYLRMLFPKRDHKPYKGYPSFRGIPDEDLYKKED